MTIVVSVLLFFSLTLNTPHKHPTVTSWRLWLHLRNQFSVLSYSVNKENRYPLPHVHSLPNEYAQQKNILYRMHVTAWYIITKKWTLNRKPVVLNTCYNHIVQNYTINLDCARIFNNWGKSFSIYALYEVINRFNQMISFT